MRKRRNFSAEFKAKVALENAISRHGVPDLLNTDQGVQFSSFGFINALKTAGVRISMGGRGRWMDNVFIERLWRSVKWEYVNFRSLSSVLSCGVVFLIIFTFLIGRHLILLFLMGNAPWKCIMIFSVP